MGRAEQATAAGENMARSCNHFCVTTESVFCFVVHRGDARVESATEALDCGANIRLVALQPATGRGL